MTRFHKIISVAQKSRLEIKQTKTKVRNSKNIEKRSATEKWEGDRVEVARHRPLIWICKMQIKGRGHATSALSPIPVPSPVSLAFMCWKLTQISLLLHDMRVNSWDTNLPVYTVDFLRYVLGHVKLWFYWNEVLIHFSHICQTVLYNHLKY